MLHFTNTQKDSNRNTERQSRPTRARRQVGRAVGSPRVVPQTRGRQKHPRVVGGKEAEPLEELWKHGGNSESRQRRPRRGAQGWPGRPGRGPGVQAAAGGPPARRGHGGRRAASRPVQAFRGTGRPGRRSHKVWGRIGRWFSGAVREATAGVPIRGRCPRHRRMNGRRADRWPVLPGISLLSP